MDLDFYVRVRTCKKRVTGKQPLVILHYYMLHKQFHRHSLYSMTSVVVLFVYRIKLNILKSKTVTKILPKKLYCDFKE